MRVVILGAKGMLGFTVCSYFKQQGFEVSTLDARWSSETAASNLEQINQWKPDACINAIGLAPREGVTLQDLVWTNGVLPGCLSQGLPADCTLIHASTDAVFAAHRSGCLWDGFQDPDTDYGRSKRQGELSLLRANDRIIRCSIIGMECHRKRSLMSWFLSQQGRVSGFTNQYWNGITTLEWARLATSMLQGDPTSTPRILQPGMLPPLSKFSLLKLLARIFEHPVEVVPTQAEQEVRRTLIPNTPTQDLDSQLAQLRQWWQALPSCESSDLSV